MAPIVGYLVLAAVVVAVLRYWSDLGKVFLDEQPDLADGGMDSTVVPLDRARRELSERSRRRVSEMSQMRAAISRDSNDAA